MTAWHNIQTTTRPNRLNRGNQIQGGSSKWTYDFAVDYRMSRGPLRGLRVGTGMRYRSGQATGYRGSNTIRNPNNPNVAIDDPNVLGSTPVWAPSTMTWVGCMSCTVRLASPGPAGAVPWIQPGGEGQVFCLIHLSGGLPRISSGGPASR